MAEYIEKQAAIKELCETYEHEYPTASGAFDEYATRIVPNVLRNLPPAVVRPVVRGRWKQTGGKYSRHKTIDRRILTCSVCGNVLYMEGVNAGRGDANFCPNCGADMRGGDADGDEKD